MCGVRAWVHGRRLSGGVEKGVPFGVLPGVVSLQSACAETAEAAARAARPPPPPAASSSPVAAETTLGGSVRERRLSKSRCEGEGAAAAGGCSWGCGRG